MNILTINGGSSSIKWALFDSQPKLRKRVTGRVTGIGSKQARFLDVVADLFLNERKQRTARNLVAPEFKG
jgi:acetate kinase